MKNLFIGFFGFFIIVFAGGSEIIYEQILVRADPEYLIIETNVTESDGELRIDSDWQVIKPIREMTITTSLSVNIDGTYQKIFQSNDTNPCEKKNNDDSKKVYKKLKKHKIQIHGNFVTDRICPLEEGFYMLRDFQIKLPESIPVELMPFGNYRLEIFTVILEHFGLFNVERDILEELYYFKYVS